MSRIFTDEELKEMGTLTIDKLKAAADTGDTEKVKRLADKMYSQLGTLHDGATAWISALLTFIYENYGAETLEKAELFAHSLEEKVAMPQSDGAPFREAVEHHCDMLMGHVFQPITVTEDDEKVMITVDPCGSGGRMVQWGSYEKGFARVKEKCPITWGLGDLPIYCVHCPVTEMMTLDAGLGFRWVHPTGDSGMDVGPNCAYWMYKDPKDIPEEYYTRLGRKKPE